MMLSLDTAYRSFGGEVEASNTPTICRLPDSRRHQLSAIARRHALRGGLHRIGRALQAVERGTHGSFEFCDASFHARGALGLGGAILVLFGGELAALDHALAEHGQRVRHRGDLVVLVALVDLAF